MENEENKIVNISSSNENGDLKITSDTSYFSEHFYFTEIYDDIYYKKFVKNVERTIRGSKEYEEYIGKLRSTCPQLNFDNVLSNISSGDASLEFHHYPFSLYDIVDIVISHKIQHDEKFTSISLAKEIMELHFKNQIGLVPLSKTTHEMAHNGYLFISTKQIFGRWKEFMNLYKDGISATLKSQIEELEERTANNTPSDFMKVL